MTKRTHKKHILKGNSARNRKIVELWRKGKKASEIAARYNVTVGTVYNAIHKTLEYDNDVYNLLLEANGAFGYTQAVITRAYMAVCRWWPETKTRADMAKLTFGAEVDNNIHITVACEKLLEEARTIAKEELEEEE